MPVSASIVAGSFVKQYYRILVEKPEDLHKFYKAPSVFSFSGCSSGGALGGTISAVGQEEIHSGIMATLRELPGTASKTEILGMDSQDSLQGGVLVLVTGYLEIEGTDLRQHFTQSFFLDKQTEPYEGYFVLNDILRFTRRNAKSASRHTAGQIQTSTDPQEPQALPEPSPAPQPAAPVAEGTGTSTAETHGPGAVAMAAGQDVEEDDRVAEVSMDIEDEEEEEDEAGRDVQLEAEVDPEDDAEDGLQPEDARDIEDAGGGQEGGPTQQQVEAGPTQQQGDPASQAASAQPDEPSLEEMMAWQDAKEKPTSWASMAGRLQQGGGSLRPSKVQGYASGPSTASRAAPPGGGNGGAYPALPPASAPTQVAAQPTLASGKASGKASGGNRQSQGGQLWVWLSRLPLEHPAENQEVTNCLNGYLAEWRCEGKVVEVQRNSSSQEWASILVSNQEAVDALVSLSKERQLLLRGKSLKAEPHRVSFGNNRRAGGRGGGGGRDDDRRRDMTSYHSSAAGEGRGKGDGRMRRRPRDGRGGGGGSYGGASAGTGSGEARPPPGSRVEQT